MPIYSNKETLEKGLVYVITNFTLGWHRINNKFNMKIMNDYFVLKSVLNSYIPADIEKPYIESIQKSMNSLIFNTRLLMFVLGSGLGSYFINRKKIWYGHATNLNHYGAVLFAGSLMILIYQVDEIIICVKSQELIPEMIKIKMPVSDFVNKVKEDAEE